MNQEQLASIPGKTEELKMNRECKRLQADEYWNAMEAKMRDKVKKKGSYGESDKFSQRRLFLCQAESHRKINAIITSSFIGHVILL